MSGPRANIIRVIREGNELTLREMGEMVGYSATYLSDVERGKLPLTPRLMAAVLAKNLHKKVGKELLKAAGKCPHCFGTGEVKAGR